MVTVTWQPESGALDPGRAQPAWPAHSPRAHSPAGPRLRSLLILGPAAAAGVFASALGPWLCGGVPGPGPGLCRVALSGGSGACLACAVAERRVFGLGAGRAQQDWRSKRLP